MSKTKFQYTVTPEDEGLPVKTLLRRRFSFSSRLLTKLKYQHLVFLNGQKLRAGSSPIQETCCQ